MDIEDTQIGRRVREIRAWRQQSQTALAGLAGISPAYLSMIERGLRPVSKRATLEALALALRVAPNELVGKPFAPSDPLSSDAHAAVEGVERAMAIYELGHDPGGPIRGWPEIQDDIDRLVDLAHVHADFAAQGELAPVLMAELHAVYVRQPHHRAAALIGLIRCYSSCSWVTKQVGGRGLPLLAARLAQQCAEALDEPAWHGYAAWLRGDATGQISRAQQYARSVAVADDLTRSLDELDVIQAYGMLHLSAALAAAAQADHDTSNTHLAEAEAVANRLDDEVGSFARLWFGRTNVAIWKVTLATEFGEGGRVAELARDVHPEVIPAPARQASFYCDYGRSLVAERATHDEGLTALLRAEKLAPQWTRNDMFVREAVGDLLRQARRDSGDRELRGLAWRMGVAPLG
nr:Putative transcriptional regulator [Kibdelosporangium sp. MJ126-NF4]